MHPNLIVHSGGSLCMGIGFLISHSMKQKLNTKSSTESEVVGVDEFMPGIFGTINCLKARDHGFTESIIFQDNRSSIILKNNGKA